MFAALTTLAFAYGLLTGPFLTADSISSEKREGSLGLLFLADVRSVDVVLGKWLASSLTGLYGLLAALPSLGIPLLLGGVTPGEYARVALAVVNAMFFALAAGLMVSALSRDQTKAILASLILVRALHQARITAWISSRAASTSPTSASRITRTGRPSPSRWWHSLQEREVGRQCGGSGSNGGGAGGRWWSSSSRG